MEPGRTVNGEGSLKLFEPNRSMVGVDWKTGFEKVLHFSTANPLRMNLSSLALGLQIPKVTNLIENFIICISPAYFFHIKVHPVDAALNLAIAFARKHGRRGMDCMDCMMVLNFQHFLRVLYDSYMIHEYT